MTTTVLAYFPTPSQGVWYLGPVPIRAYALFIIIGIVVALVIGDRRWEARGGERGVIYDIALWAVPFGLIGGRLYHVITDWPKYFGDGGAGWVGALRIWDGGLGIWGAVALGGVGAWIACRYRGIPLPAFGDAIAPGIVLAQAIGRLGNYFNQELYGRPTTLPWGLEIYMRENASGVVSPDLANGVSTGQLHSIVHPTFLYELLWNVLVFAVLIWVDRRFKIGHGRLFALYVAGYCLGRFWIELLRDDQATLIADIRVNSFTSTFMFIGAVVYIMVAPRGREDPATLKGTAVDEESPIDEMAEELVAAAATTGVVAAAKVAGDDEAEDAGADETEDAGADEVEDEDAEVEDEPVDESDVEAEAAADAEVLAKAVADAADEEAEPTDEAEAESADEAAEEPEPEGESEDLETDESVEEPETEDAEDAVADAAAAAPSDEEAAEQGEAVVDEADATEESESEAEAFEFDAPQAEAPDETESDAQEAAIEVSAEPAEAAPSAESADEAAGGFRRWLRGRRDG